ncbi:MAG TPA: hypothetical protein VMU34_06010 [Mycobacterium sp.]|nr:hypothetical protein [Mycobacterium sp.]
MPGKPGASLVASPTDERAAEPSPSPMWWWDVRRGRDSPYARYFHINWAPDDEVGGKLALPLLGSDDDTAGLVVDGDPAGMQAGGQNDDRKQGA